MDSFKPNSTPTLSPRVGVAIGEQVMDMHAVAELGLLSEFKLDTEVFLSEFLNELISLGKPLSFNNSCHMKILS